MNYQKFSLLLGFVVWLMATLVFRFWGHYFFLVDNMGIMLAFYILVLPILFFLVHFVLKKYQLSSGESLKSAVLMAMPGMLLDTFCIAYHPIVFPTFTQEQTIVLSSWLLWVYGVVLLLGGLAAKPNPKK